MRIRFALFLAVLLVSGGANAQPITLFDFNTWDEDWTTSPLNVGSVSRNDSDGALDTAGSLQCSGTGAWFGCTSPDIVNPGFSGYNAIILYRKDVNRNLRDRMEIWVMDQAGHEYVQTTVWAKRAWSDSPLSVGEQDWSELVITPYDLEYVQGGGGDPGVPIDLDQIKRIRLFVPEAADPNKLTEFRVDEIHLVSLVPIADNPNVPTVTVDTSNENGAISDNIYGVNLAFWDSEMGLRGSGEYFEGFSPQGNFIDSNFEFKNQVIDVWEKNYMKLHDEIGLRSMRFPGGLQGNHYWWKDYVGPVQGDPPNVRKGTTNVLGNNRLTLWFAAANYPYKIRAAIGVDEFLKWCEDLDAEPIMQINMTDAVEDAPGFLPCTIPRVGNPDLEQLAQLAADLVEYCNAPYDEADPIDYGGAAGTDGINWARKRAENGHKAPYNVTHWEFGNELWTCYEAVDYAFAVTAIIDAMETRQAAINNGNVLPPPDPDLDIARNDMYCIAVDNGGGGAHLETDEDWYSTILGVANAETIPRIDSWARHAYVNGGDNSGPAPSGMTPGGKVITMPTVSGIRLGADTTDDDEDVSIDLTVDFPEGGTWRLWTYLIAITNGQGSTPKLDLYLDGAFTDLSYGGDGDDYGDLPLKPNPPSERFLDIDLESDTTRTISLRPNGCYISPNGGPDDPDSQYIVVFPVIKAVNHASGEVLALDMMFDEEYGKVWTTGQVFNSRNFIEPVSELAGIEPAITEWNYHLAVSGNEYKYLTGEVDDQANILSLKSGWGVTHNGDTIMGPLGLIDYFFKFPEYGVKVASYHQLYQDSNQMGLIEGVPRDSYTPAGGIYEIGNEAVVDEQDNWEIGAIDRSGSGADGARLRPMAMLFGMLSPNYRGKAIETTIEDSPIWEVEWTDSFVADDATVARMGIGSLSAANWESGNNGFNYGFATGAAGGSLAAKSGSGKFVNTISVASAMPDGKIGDRLNIILANKENMARTVNISLVGGFAPDGVADTLVLGVDSNGLQLPEQTGTDPISDWTGGMEVRETQIQNASANFAYTLPGRTIHVIKLVRSGADATAPPAPASITADGTINGGMEMWLSWPASANPDGDLFGYNVYRSRSQGGPYRQKVNVDGPIPAFDEEDNLIAVPSIQDMGVDDEDQVFAGGGPAQWAYAVTAVDDNEVKRNESEMSPRTTLARFGISVTGAGTPPPPPTAETLHPETVIFTYGVATDPSVNMESNDDVFYHVFSRTSGFLVTATDWYGVHYITGDEANVTKLEFSYSGKYSTQRNQSLWVYNFTDEQWEGLGMPQVVIGEVTVTDEITSDISKYIENSKIRFRVEANSQFLGSYTCAADEMTVDVTY